MQWRLFSIAALQPAGTSKGWVAEEVNSDNGDNVYETLLCLACNRHHVVNPSTGKVLGADND